MFTSSSSSSPSSCFSSSPPNVLHLLIIVLISMGAARTREKGYDGPTMASQNPFNGPRRPLQTLQTAKRAQDGPCHPFQIQACCTVL
eukprot:7223993-Pyramimonas_sp.AAC.1